MYNQYDKIVENRPMIETLVLGTLLKSLTLYGEYKQLSEQDFIIEKVKYLFSLGKVMSKTHSELDQASVLQFVNTNKEFKAKYEEMGGWNSISKAMEYGNENNVRAYVDDLAKNNMLIAFDVEGFTFTENKTMNGKEYNPFYDLFPNMTSKEVAQYFEGLISKCAVNSISNDVKAEGLTLRKKDRLRLKEKLDAGTPYDVMFEYTEKEIGLSDSEEPRYVYASPIMSYATNGLGDGGGITVLAGFSGIGKSTYSFLNKILPMAHRKVRCLIFSNEQKSDYFKHMVTSFVAANVFKYYDLSRRKIANGDFTEEEEVLMDKIEKFLDDRDFDNYIQFISMEEFKVEEIIRISKEYVTHKGYSCIFVDTFKSENSSDSNYTGQIIESSKQLDAFGNKYNVKVILTMQMVTAEENKASYLSAGYLAEAKAVKNVCDLLFLMRKVVNDLELNPENKKFFLRPYRLKQNLKGEMYREYITISEKEMQKDYRLLFLNKSRRGSDDLVVLLKFNGKSGKFEEIGHVEHVHRGQLSY